MSPMCEMKLQTVRNVGIKINLVRFPSRDEAGLFQSESHIPIRRSGGYPQSRWRHLTFLHICLLHVVTGIWHHAPNTSMFCHVLSHLVFVRPPSCSQWTTISIVFASFCVLDVPSVDDEAVIQSNNADILRQHSCICVCLRGRARVRSPRVRVCFVHARVRVRRVSLSFVEQSFARTTYT